MRFCLGLIMLFLFFSGCNSQMADLSPIHGVQRVTVTIAASNLTTETNVLVYMMSADNRNGFGRVASLPVNISREMPIGTYKFYGISYNGLTLSKCAIATEAVGEFNTSFTLDFQQTTCADPVFIGPSSQLNIGTAAAPQFANSILEACNSLGNVTSGGDRCTDDLTNINRVEPRGHITSYDYALLDYDLTDGQVAESGNEIDFGCSDGRPFFNQLNGQAQSYVGSHIPAGDGVTTPFRTRFRFYSRNTSCSSALTKTVTLPKGLVSTQEDFKYFYNSAIPNYHTLYVRVSDTDICSADTSGEFAGGEGTRASPKLICTVSDLYDIFPSTSNALLYQSYANYNYKLLSDLDLTALPVKGNPAFTLPWAPCVTDGSNFMPIGLTWDGACGVATMSSVFFDGGGHTIRGLKIYRNGPAGFYNNFEINSKFQNITFESPDIDGSFDVGVVAAVATETSVRNVTINNPIVDGNASDRVGGLIGTTYGVELKDINITNLTLRGRDLVGGVVGVGGSWFTATRLERVFVSGSLSGQSYVGGLVGQLGGASILSPITISRFTGSIQTTGSYIGGIIGLAHHLLISASYADTSFNSSAVANVNLGGLVGYAASHVAGAGIYSSYANWSPIYACPISTTCSIDNIVGNADVAYLSSDFSTAIYPTELTVTNYSAIDFGTAYPAATFMSLSPPWLPDFPVSTWDFSTTAYPKLQAEP